jgi:methionyl-tRNA formyltransferase
MAVTDRAFGKYPRTLLLSQAGHRPFQTAIARGIREGGGYVVAIVEPFHDPPSALQLWRRRFQAIVRNPWSPGLARRLSLIRDVHDPSFLEQLEQLRVDLMVVSRWGLIRPEVFEKPSLGTLNTHLSLLPELRGPTPVEGALLAGLTRTGVTIHFINAGIDTGDIVLQRRLAIHSTDTEHEIHLGAAKLMRQMYTEVIQSFRSGHVPRYSPVSSEEFYFSWRKCFASNPSQPLAIDWRAPAWLIQRAVHIRPCYTRWQNLAARLVEARVVRGHEAAGTPGEVISTQGARIRVKTGEGIIETRLECGDIGNQVTEEVMPAGPAPGERLHSATWPGWSKFASWAVKLQTSES